MLVNWILAEFKENYYINQLINSQDLKLLVTQFCTDLVAAHVLKQLPDKEVPMYNIFKVSFFSSLLLQLFLIIYYLEYKCIHIF